MNHYFMLCVVFGIICSLHASAEEKLENLPLEEYTISNLYDRINALEVQLKRLAERDDEMKKVIDDKDDKMDSLEDQVKTLSSQLKDLQGHSAIEPSFIVTATKSNGHIPPGDITFDNKILDPSNAFDIDRGTFKVPESGNYLFQFNGHVFNTGYSGVFAYVNGNVVYYFDESNDNSSYLSHAYNFMFDLELEDGDELWLYNDYSSTLWDDTARPMTFIGYKTS